MSAVQVVDNKKAVVLAGHGDLGKSSSPVRRRTSGALQNAGACPPAPG